MTDDNLTPDTELPTDPSDPGFYARFTSGKNFPMWDALRKAGVSIREDGKSKFLKAMFKAIIIELMQSWTDGIITDEQLLENIQGLGSGKLTRYKVEVDLAARRRQAKS